MTTLSDAIRAIPVKDSEYVEEDNYVNGFNAGLEAAARLVDARQPSGDLAGALLAAGARLHEDTWHIHDDDLPAIIAALRSPDTRPDADATWDEPPSIAEASLRSFATWVARCSPDTSPDAGLRICGAQDGTWTCALPPHEGIVGPHTYWHPQAVAALRAALRGDTDE